MKGDEQRLADALKPFGWLCTEDFWQRYYSDPWVFNLANAVDALHAQIKQQQKDALMEGARLIVRNGRAWLPLTDEDVERGARAIVSDPHYRDELVRSAIQHAQEIGNPDGLLSRVIAAADALSRRQHGAAGGGATDAG